MKKRLTQNSTTGLYKKPSITVLFFLLAIAVYAIVSTCQYPTDKRYGYRVMQIPVQGIPPRQKALMVIDVAAEGVFDMAGIKAGDVITGRISLNRKILIRKLDQPTGTVIMLDLINGHQFKVSLKEDNVVNQIELIAP
jgi:hypothetical protein